jgi:predicted ATP-grasp superfamily ATP-dependent carboligase
MQINDPQAVAAYVDAVSAAIGLKIDPEYRAAVQADMSRIASIAAFLMEFPLDQDVEPAPVFRP